MFGENLKLLREDKGLLQRDLAKILMVTSQTISGWEIGRTQPEYDMLIKIADYFKVSVDYLLGHNTTNKMREDELNDKEVFKRILVRAGFMKSDEVLTNEDMDRIIRFIVNNKEFLINIK